MNEILELGNSLKHSDFYIGMEFWSETGRWRCTDVGKRTICAISLEPREITTLHPDGTRTSSISDDPSWLNGPPYAVAECVFDEYSFASLYAKKPDDGEPKVLAVS